MIDFIQNNKEWLFSGIGVAILMAFVAFIRKKFSKKENVAIHLSTLNINAVDNRKDDIALPIERISSIAFQDIHKALEKAAPLQREEIEKSFTGIKVEWNTYLKTASKDDNDMVTLRLTTNRHIPLDTITCKVLLSDYRELGIMPEGSKIRILGEIAEASSWDVSLKNVKLFFIENELNT